MQQGIVLVQVLTMLTVWSVRSKPSVEPCVTGFKRRFGENGRLESVNVSAKVVLEKSNAGAFIAPEKQQCTTAPAIHVTGLLGITHKESTVAEETSVDCL